MSQENVDLVRAIYDAWAKRASLAHLIAPDLEYINPPNAVEAGTRHHRAALDRVRDVYPDFRMDAERYVDAGDEVVVIGIARGTGASGVTIQWRQGHIWTVQNDQAIRFRWFNNPAEALEAVGLLE